MSNIPDLPKEGIIIVLEAMAAGTFIYVTFLEVLAQERANDHSNLVQLGAILLGFLVITGIQLYEQATEM
jgi:zinc transporter 1/2/3